MSQPPDAIGPIAPSFDLAVQRLRQLVDQQRGGDQAYLGHQLPRYVRTLQRLRELHPPPCRVLDIGSHYLHQAVLLSELGYQVTGTDIALFTQPAFVQQRARVCGIDNVTVDDLESGSFLPGQEGRFELIVFTEILEHITFNPIRLWRRIYELLAPGGQIFVSTPNALRPVALLRQLKALLCLRGIGIPLDDIMDNVTYGHHWKEYSAWELKRYFALLSGDFDVRTRWYAADHHASHGVKRLLKRGLAAVPCLRSDIEAVVRRNGSSGFRARPPQLGMQQVAAGEPLASGAAAARADHA